MLEVKHYRAEDYKTVPWKNGRGETHEICVDEASPFRWRLSWAPLPISSPFSPFPGYERHLVLLEGGPVTLTHPGQRQRRILGPMSSYTFSGDWHSEAEVLSPAEDFNVFTLREESKAGVYPTFLSKDEDLQFPLVAQEHFVFGVRGNVELYDPNSNAHYVIAPKDTLRLSRRSRKEFLNLKARGQSDQSSCLWVVVHVLDSLSKPRGRR